MATKFVRYSPPAQKFKEGEYLMEFKISKPDNRKGELSIYNIGSENSVPIYLGLVDLRSQSFDNIRFGLKKFDIKYVGGASSMICDYFFFNKDGGEGVKVAKITHEDANLVAENSFPLNKLLECIPSDMRFD